MTDEKNEVHNEEPATMLEEIKKVRDEVKELIEQKKAMINEEEKQKAMQMLRGRADGGASMPAKPVETPQEYAARIMRGGK